MHHNTYQLYYINTEFITNINSPEFMYKLQRNKTHHSTTFCCLIKQHKLTINHS